jgi:hypothetical protein
VAQGKCRALDLACTRELPFGATARGADEQPLPIEGYMYRLNIRQTGGGGSNTQTRIARSESCSDSSPGAAVAVPSKPPSQEEYATPFERSSAGQGCFSAHKLGRPLVQGKSEGTFSLSQC